jgi:hypothetical protein
MSKKDWEFPNKADDIAIVAVIDKSGSMATTVSDTLGGFNAFKKEQASQPGRAYMSVSLFSTECQILYPSAPIADIPDLNKKTYVPSGGTALYDAVAETIQEVSKSKNLPKRVLFLVITDGEENSSRKFTTPDSVRALINEKTAQGWDFIYIGADASAWNASHSLGFASAGVYEHTTKGIHNSYTSISNTVLAMRSSGMSSADFASNFTTNSISDTLTPASAVYANNGDIYVKGVLQPKDKDVDNA